MHSRNIANLPPEALLRLPEVTALVGLCRASIYARAAKQSFPSPIKLTTHASGWRLSDVRAWLADPTGWRPTGNSSPLDHDKAQGMDL